MNLGHWVKHFLIYGTGVILMNALPLLLIPIYTHGVTPAEYGVIELLNRSQELMLVIFSLGLRSTLLTLYQMEEGNSDRRAALYSTAIQLLIISTLVLVLGVAAFSRPIASLMFGTNSFAVYVAVILAATYFETLFQIAALYLQSELKSTAYVLTFAGRALFSILVNLLLVSVLKLGLKGILWAMMIHTVTSTLLLLVYVFRRTGLAFRKEMVPDMLKFGLPLVPAAIMMFVMNNGDRYFLNTYSGRDEVGVYGLGYRLAQTASTLVLLPFGKIWSVVMVNIARAEDGPYQLGRISTYLVAALTWAALCASLLAPYAIWLLSAPAYFDAYKIVAPVAAAYLLFSWTVVMDASFYITKRTGFKPVILGISGAVMLALYFWLIPRYGMFGAAWATLGGFIAFTITTLLFAQRIYRIAYEWGRTVKLLAAGAGLFVVADLLPPERPAAIFLRVTAILVFVGLLGTDFLSHAWERDYVRSYCKVVWNRFFGRRESVSLSGGS